MIVALSAVACVMVVIGLGLVVQGAPFTRMEWGWTMVLSGTVTATGGLLLAGIAVLAAGLRRVERALGRQHALQPASAAGDPPRGRAPGSSPGATPGEAAENRAILATADLVAIPPETALRPSLTPEAETSAEAPMPEAPTVVRTYSSGGSAYVMYSDGTIKADTPRGRFTFGSIDELKTFMAEGA